MSTRHIGSSLYLNRELSWLAFNARVLHEALDARVPLLERVKFLGDLQREPRRVLHGARCRPAAAGRRGRHRRRRPTDSRRRSSSTRSTREVARLLALQRALPRRICSPSSRRTAFGCCASSDLTPSEWGAVDEYFESQVFPVLTPLAVDPGHPFPYISNLSLSLAVEIRDPETRRRCTSRA